MNVSDLINEDGRIVKGVNTTVDVGPNEIKTQAKKFGNSVDKDGKPPTHSKKIKGKSTNVLFNLGLSEGIMLKFQRGEDFDTLHIKPKGKNRVELRGKPGYERGNYDAQDKLHQVLDNLGKAANFAELMNGETVSINPKHPDGERAKKTAQDILSTESVSKDELKKQLAMGVKVEMEHTDNPKLALKIAIDHIKEDPLYYDHLKFVELGEALGEIAQSTEIFVDMDGVLADFFGDWAKLMGVDHWTDIGKDQVPDALEKIKQTENFWLDLPLTNNAKQLLGLIKDVKGEYSILSSPLPGDPNSEPHKREWIEKHLGFFPPKEVIITHDKAKYATQEDGTPNILIDDYGVNINKWEAAGGYGFKHKDHKFERTAKNIKQHMQEPVEEGSLRMPTSQLRSMIIQMLQDMETQHDTAMLAKIARMLGKEVYFTKKGDQVVLQDPDFDFYSKENIDTLTKVYEKWSQKYKRSINCNNPKGFSQKAHCAGRKKSEGIEENFADGKKKGKSRPGRVKRSGASCNGSVTSLRKRAKNSSGEKARMYHWCANMKSGRKKKS